MKKRTVMHREGLNVTVKILKSDFANKIYKEPNTKKEYLLAGTLVKTKNSEDIREKGANVIPINGGEKASGILVHDVEFRPYRDQEVGTVAIEGIAYIDKLVEVGKEHTTPLTVTKAELPAGITYIYKDRK